MLTCLPPYCRAGMGWEGRGSGGRGGGGEGWGVVIATPASGRLQWWGSGTDPLQCVDPSGHPTLPVGGSVGLSAPQVSSRLSLRLRREDGRSQ